MYPYRNKLERYESGIFVMVCQKLITGTSKVNTWRMGIEFMVGLEKLPTLHKK